MHIPFVQVYDGLRRGTSPVAAGKRRQWRQGAAESAGGKCCSQQVPGKPVQWRDPMLQPWSAPTPGDEACCGCVSGPALSSVTPDDCPLDVSLPPSPSYHSRAAVMGMRSRSADRSSSTVPSSSPASLFPAVSGEKDKQTT